jgi:hypothetical protein
MSSTNRGTKRNKNDFYPTPKWCTQELLALIDWSSVGSYYEPCLGDGAIYDLIPLKNKDWSEIQKGRDYLNTCHQKVDLIITNPPYSNALNFIRVALSHSKTVIMLLRLNFLESQSRYDFWKSNPPSHLIILLKRPSFTGKGTDSTAYAWVVWSGDGVINGPSLQWIK